MTLSFTKMHGCGNDYIYINCLEKELENPQGVARILSPRHFSVGGDGVVLICSSEQCDVKMRMFNLDGSEGKMCGNAIRCVGKYLFDKGFTQKTSLSVETLSGTKYLTLFPGKDGKIEKVSVKMGKAEFDPEKIPVLHKGEMISQEVEVNGKNYAMTAVSMGNPHSVIFGGDPAELALEKIGPIFENLSIFPERVNTEFIQVLDSKTLKMRVWERGSGETFACGTGACASVAAAVKNGICPPGEEITVKLVGGDLSILCEEDFSITMTGPATTVYEGKVEL